MQPIVYLLNVEDADFVGTWMRRFAALARSKKQQNKINERENEITYLFAAPSVCKAKRKISLMTYSIHLEEHTFYKIKEIFLGNVGQSYLLVIPEPTKVRALKLECIETIMKFLRRLQSMNKY